MTDQPGTDRFQALLESALQVYEETTGTKLTDLDYSLAIELQDCRSTPGMATLLRKKAQDFKDLRQRDRIFGFIETIVSILSPISAVVSAVDDAGLVRQKVLKACLAFLTIFTGITATCESDTFYYWHPTERMYHS